jgi:predicted dehydrogenase
MSKKIRWGVLGDAKIAREHILPAIAQGECSETVALASRDLGRARATCARLHIPKAYGSYEELLADPEVDAVYNPLPNHLHALWTIRAAAAGKHVLCEKPAARTVEECRTMIEARDRYGVVVGEAFMVRTNPQWIYTRDAARSGALGALRAVMAEFSFFNRDLKNIRNILEYGGGAMYDIGCYTVQVARFLFGEEPRRVVSLVDRDPESGVDRLASAILDFPSGQAVFTCGIQHVYYQRVQALCEKGRLEIEIPFNAPADRPCRVFTDTGADQYGSGVSLREFPVVNQYALQNEMFCRAIAEGTAPPTPLEDSLGNLAVIEAVFRSARTGAWEKP